MSTTLNGSAYAAFDLQYDGPALQAHEMDVRALAPALISVADLFQELSHLTRPADPPVNVNVRATSEGSFLIELRLLYELAEYVLQTPQAIAAATLVTLVAGAGMIFRLIKGRPKSETPADEQGLVRVVFADGTTLEIPEAIMRASRSAVIRRSIYEIVEPLSRDGIDTLTIRQEEVIIASVTSAEMTAYEYTEPVTGRDVLATSERDVFLTILTLGFESGRWRFTDGQSPFTARVADNDFLLRVERGEKFSKQDVLRCRISETQWRDAKGLHQDATLMKVLEHIPAPEQGQFDIEDSA